MQDTSTVTAAGNAPRLTKLEQFVNDNPDMPFTVMASQLNRTVDAMERAYDRLQRKLAAAAPPKPTAEELLALQNSRIRRLYALLDQITNRCRYSLQIRADDDNRREDIAWIRNQIEEQTFTIGGAAAR